LIPVDGGPLRLQNRGDAAMRLGAVVSMYDDMGMTLWSQDMAVEIT
jgi:hypothetical protein